MDDEQHTAPPAWAVGTRATEPFLSSPGPGTRQAGSFSVREEIYLLDFWITMPSNCQVLVIWAAGNPSVKGSQGPEKLEKAGAKQWRKRAFHLAKGTLANTAMNKIS